MKIQIQTQECVSSNQINDITISIEQVLDLIETGSTITNQLHIATAREHGKGTVEYTRIKTHKLPSFLFNFNFGNGSLANKNIISSTGLFYADIDNVGSGQIEHLKEELSNIPYVLAVWKSLSENGLSVLFKVSGLDTNNYNEFKDYILNTYTQFNWDLNAFKKIQKTVLSYDYNLYRNLDCKSLSYSTVKNSVYINNPPFTINIDTIKEKVFIVNGGLQNNKEHYTLKPQYINKKKLKTSTEANFNTDEVYIIHTDKVLVNRIYLTKQKVQDGNTNSIMSLWAVKLVDINDLNEEDLPVLLVTLQSLNLKGCQKKLDEKELTKIAISALKRKGQHQYELYEKKVTFNSVAGFSVSEKMDIGRKAGKQSQKNKTLTTLKENYKTGMTAKALSEITGKGLRTIERYWKELKESVQPEITSIESNTAIIKQIQPKDDISIQNTPECSISELYVYVNPDIIDKSEVAFTRVYNTSFLTSQKIAV